MKLEAQIYFVCIGNTWKNDFGLTNNVLTGMSEEDLCDLLKFDRKMLRQRISTLRADRFIQARMKMVTLEDNKTQKEQYYFINYKVSYW